MLKKVMLTSFVAAILFISCKSVENPNQIGNKDKLDIFHQQKKVR